MGASNSERRRHAIKNGYRSGLEEDISKDLIGRGVDFEYEKLKIQWQLIEQKTYTPDFKLPNGIIIESKGMVVAVDRMNHLKVKSHHTFLDISLLFSNSRAKLTKWTNIHVGVC